MSEEFFDDLLADTDRQLNLLEDEYAATEDRYLEIMKLRAMLTAPATADKDALLERLHRTMPMEARKALRAAVDSRREAQPPPPPPIVSEEAAAIPPPKPAPPVPPRNRATLGELMASEGLGIQEAEITEEQARDVFKYQKGKQFTSQVLMDEYDISRTQANKYLEEYCVKGIIRHVKGRGAMARYVYVPPPPGGPTEHPRHDGPREMAAKVNGRGAPVAGTGKSRASTSVVGQRRPGRTHGKA